MTDTWVGSITHGRTFQENSDLGDETTTDIWTSGPLIEGLLGLQLRGSVYDKDESTPEYDATTAPDGSIYQPSTGFGGGGKTSDQRNYSGGIRLSLSPGDRHELILDHDISRQKYDNREGQFGSLDTVANAKRGRTGYTPWQRISREQTSLAHIGHWDFGRSEVTLTHLNTKNDGRSLPLTAEERKALLAAGGNSAPDDWVQDNLLPRDNRNLSSKGWTLDAKLELPLGAHFMVVGGQIVDQEMTDGAFGILTGQFRGNARQDHKQWSLFVEDNWSVTDAFTLTAGVRYDDHRVFGGHVSPRIYGVYNLTDAWTLKGGISTGYKTPKTSDLYPGITGFGGQGTSPWAGNPDLDPETSTSGELALYYNSPAGHNFNITGFVTKFKDKIQNTENCRDNPSGSTACAAIDPWWTLPTGQGGGGYAVSYKGNVSDAEIKGIEVAGRYLLPYGFSLKGNYTYTDSEVTSGPAKGRPLTGNPTSASSSSADTTAKHMANLTLDWQANKDLVVFLGVSAEKDRYRGWDADGNFLPDYKAFQVWHLGATFNASDNLTFSGRINNLFDRDFTSYKVSWTQDQSGNWVGTKQDDYKVIHKSRNFWLSANLRF